MRLGIDVDDTIAKTHQEIVRLALEYDKKYVKGKGFKDRNALYLVDMFYWQVNDAKRFITYLRNVNYYKDLEVMDEANKYINMLYDEGYEVFFITRRNDNIRVRSITVDWLRRNSFKYHELILGAINKGEVCKRMDIDLFIDNDPVNIDDALDYGVRGLVITDTYNKDDNEYIRCNTWKEIYDYVKGENNGKNC